MSAPTDDSGAPALIVSRRNAGRIGTLTFDAQNRITLHPEDSGPALEELRKALDEIAKMPKVPSVITFVEETPQGQVTAIETEEYGRDHPNYFYAVLDTLGRVYGFRADIAK